MNSVEEETLWFCGEEEETSIHALCVSVKDWLDWGEEISEICNYKQEPVSKLLMSNKTDNTLNTNKQIPQ